MSAALGLFPRRRRAPVADHGGYSARQLCELARLQARFGAIHAYRHSGGLVEVALVGDHPEPGSRPVTLTLDVDGRVIGRGRMRPIEAAA